MADRISQVLIQTEYAPVHKNRVSQVLAQVEYTPVHKNRISQVLIMVEYALPPPHVRVYGPAIQ